MRHRGQTKLKGQCTGKFRYNTDREAQLEIERAQQCRGETLRAYSCRRCGSLHLTSMPLATYEKWKRKR